MGGKRVDPLTRLLDRGKERVLTTEAKGRVWTTQIAGNKVEFRFLLGHQTWKGTVRFEGQTVLADSVSLNSLIWKLRTALKNS
jgi:hypothetical protein